LPACVQQRELLALLEADQAEEELLNEEPEMTAEINAV
jgi:hypothetical protein